MTNFSINPSSVRVDEFKESGKWYGTSQIDMSNVYNEPDIFSAVMQAMYSSGFHMSCTNFFAIVLDPYHKNSHPVCISAQAYEEFKKDA